MLPEGGSRGVRAQQAQLEGRQPRPGAPSLVPREAVHGFTSISTGPFPGSAQLHLLSVDRDSQNSLLPLHHPLGHT